MLSNGLEISLKLAINHAMKYGHHHLTTEHLLLALLDNFEAVDFFVQQSINIQRLRHNLESYLASMTSHEAGNPGFIQMDELLQCIIDELSNNDGRQHTTPANGIDAIEMILRKKQSKAYHFLQAENISLRSVLQHSKLKTPSAQKGEDQDPMSFSPFPGAKPFAYDDFSSQGPAQMKGKKAKAADAQQAEENEHAQYLINLNEHVMDNSPTPMIGRKEEHDRMVRILCRKHKNNPLLIGEPGVGKSSIVENLALSIAKNRVIDDLKGKTIYSLDIGAMVAGTKYRGDFEKRIKAMIKFLKTNKNAILFIDEIHTIVGAGSSTGTNLDASNLLKPALARSEIRCIGATTYDEYRQIFSNDKALSRRFHRVELKENSMSETITIMNNIADHYEKYHSVSVSKACIRHIVELADRYIKDRHFPDKAIDILDECCAFLKIKAAVKKGSCQELSKQDVDEVISKMLMIPLQELNENMIGKLTRVSNELERSIYGQEHVIHKVMRTLKISYSGLNPPNKPLGSFLFVGSTGVGKTQFCNQLADSLHVPCIRLDMSEYMERHTFSSLIGAPSGYVGYEEGGHLTEKIKKNPHCVLLLDEIEKAHPDVLNLLLQVMDYGFITDNAGNKISFLNVIVAMTTNLGFKRRARQDVGFSSAYEAEHKVNMEEVTGALPPEFRGRLDEMIVFNEHNDTSIRQLIKQHLKALNLRVKNNGMQISMDRAAYQWMIAQSLNECSSGRMVAKLFNSQIINSVADCILEQDNEPSTLKIVVDNNELKVMQSAESSA